VDLALAVLRRVGAAGLVGAAAEGRCASGSHFVWLRSSSMAVLWGVGAGGGWAKMPSRLAVHA